MVGVWDASRSDSPLGNSHGKACAKALEDEANAGYLFLIHTGGDGGVPIDVFVNEEIPGVVIKQCKPPAGEFLIRVPTGRLVIGSVEDYRSPKPRITDDESLIHVPKGDYALRCFSGTEEGGFNPPTRAELAQSAAAEDYSYFRKIQNSALGIYFAMPVTFLVLIYCVGWKLALVITTTLSTAFYLAIKQWTIRNKRFKRAARAVNECWRQAAQGESPTFVLELRRINDSSGLKGGSVRS